MAINKVVYGNTPLIDLTSDTITAADVLNSKTFHDASGTLRTGSADISGKADKVQNATADNFAALDANGNLKDSGHKHSDYVDSSALDEWSATATVSSGSVTFSGIDDTNNNAYKLFVNVTSSSTNKNPTAKISSISGNGTNSMTIKFSVTADSGATCKLRIIK